MKKKIQFICWIVILMLIGGFCVAAENNEIHFQVDEDGGMSFLFTVNGRQEILYPWWNEEDGRYYFFLPAFCESGTGFICRSMKTPLFMQDECE